METTGSSTSNSNPTNPFAFLEQLTREIREVADKSRKSGHRHANEAAKELCASALEMMEGIATDDPNVTAARYRETKRLLDSANALLKSIGADLPAPTATAASGHSEPLPTRAQTPSTRSQATAIRPLDAQLKVGVGSIEDFYRRRAAESNRTAQATEVQQYNRWVANIRDTIPKILASVAKNPPRDCVWVVYDGVEYVSWELWRDYDYDSSINLMSNGLLISLSLSLGRVTGSRILSLKEIGCVEDQKERDINWHTLRDLYTSFEGHLKFGFGVDLPDLYRDTFKAWDRNHK